MAVLLPVGDFDDYQAFIEQRSVQHAVEAGERDVAAGRTVPHEDVMKLLERWSGGE